MTDVDLCEIFYSIQGESSYAGRPCVFVRLSGCNLDCSYCDTPYAKSESHPAGIADIAERVAAYNCNLLEITGGEPLLQTKTPDLVRYFLEKEYTVLLETNGSLSIREIDERCVRILDIKCPSSGEEANNFYDNIGLLTPRDEVKFVVAGREDYEFAKSFLTANRIGAVTGESIHISPVWGELGPDTLASWMLADNLDARLSIQLHKVIWDENRRGV